MTKPSIFEGCGVAASGLSIELAGESVLFSDFLPDAPITIGHPAEMEHFCGRHLKAARELSNMSSIDAISKLRLDTGLSPPVLVYVPQEMPE